MKQLLQTLIKPLAMLALCASSSAAFAVDKTPVMASFSILGDLVRVVGADRVAVTTLVGPDGDAHVFEPKPADAKNLLQTRLLVTNGLDFEHWAQKLEIIRLQGAGHRSQLPQANASQRRAVGDGHETELRQRSFAPIAC